MAIPTLTNIESTLRKELSTEITHLTQIKYCHNRVSTPSTNVKQGLQNVAILHLNECVFFLFWDVGEEGEGGGGILLSKYIIDNNAEFVLIIVELH